MGSRSRWSLVGLRPGRSLSLRDEGFDVAADGSDTGWRAYAYFPLPGGFWPTNGSFGDALIRLPAPFRQDLTGKPSREVYVANLAVLESLIARRDVAIPPLDERVLGVDLDGNGKLSRATRVRYRWVPGGGGMSYAGGAKELTTQLAVGLFPEGTELLHSLRYLDVQGEQVRRASRMKELRYMRKTKWLSFGYLETQAMREAREKEESPNKLRVMRGDAEHGISNASGWRLQGFIEDTEGALRPQTLEEHAFCIGCHSGVGATDDSVFSFGRKLDGEAPHRGWYSGDWRKIGEPRRADGAGEYSHYLEQNGAATSCAPTTRFSKNSSMPRASCARIGSRSSRTTSRACSCRVHRERWCSTRPIAASCWSRASPEVVTRPCCRWSKYTASYRRKSSPRVSTWPFCPAARYPDS